MKSAHNQSIVLVAIVSLMTFYGSVQVPVQGHAEDDEATKIYQLARRLHDEDTDRGSFTVWVNGDIGEDMTARRTSVNGGDPLPAFKLTLFDGNSTLEPKDLKGPRILNFWSSWCSVCRTDFALFTRRIKDKSLVVPVIFVNTLDFRASAEAVIASVDPSNRLTLAFDPDSLLFSSLWFTVNPDTVLVDADDRIQAIQIGAVSDLSLEFFNEIAEHPGVGSFDRLHPDDWPLQRTATPDRAGTRDAASTAQPLPSSTPG
jgi:thiol-disulfide isomerase/thioredoxin